LAAASRRQRRGLTLTNRAFCNDALLRNPLPDVAFNLALLPADTNAEQGHRNDGNCLWFYWPLLVASPAACGGQQPGQCQGDAGEGHGH
jgi:hypothetical protein